MVYAEKKKKKKKLKNDNIIIKTYVNKING